MYASDDCGAAILSAAHQARVLAVQLFSTPNDPALIGPFFETAATIDEVGQKLGIGELSELSVRLVTAAKRELSSDADPSQLDSVLSKLAAIADRVSQQTAAQPHGRTAAIEDTEISYRLASTDDWWPSKR